MKTLIISSSLSNNSKSFILCREVEKQLKDKGVYVDLVDMREIEIRPTHMGETQKMKQLSEKMNKYDNFIFGMGVHCYSINDSLKMCIDNCFEEENMRSKFYGILCAAGGERSYLATMHLTQICLNEWRMIQLPRVVYATKSDFKDEEIASSEIQERIKLFVEEFIKIGEKLI